MKGGTHHYMKGKEGGRAREELRWFVWLRCVDL